MDYLNLKYFVTAAYNLNFSEVARNNYISQSAISHQIGKLEQELGLKLFFRNGKKLALTEEGENFLPIASALLANMEDAFLEVKKLKNQERQINILLSETGIPIFRQCIGPFAKKYPDTPINVFTPQTKDVIRIVLEKKYDVLFTFENMLSSSNGYDYIRIDDDPLCLVLPQNAPEISDIHDFSPLQDMTYVGISHDFSTYLVGDIEALMRDRGFIPKMTHTHSKLNSVMIAVEQGVGYSILPISIAQDGKYDVRAIPLHDRSAARVVAWKNANCSEITTLFGAFARKQFKGELIHTRGQVAEQIPED